MLYYVAGEDFDRNLELSNIDFVTYVGQLSSVAYPHCFMICNFHVNSTYTHKHGAPMHPTIMIDC